MERIITQAKKSAEEVEVYTISSEEITVQFQANHLKHIQSKQSSRIALRIIKGGRIGYATTTEMSDRQTLINNAIENKPVWYPIQI
jgi:PmbA protein